MGSSARIGVAPRARRTRTETTPPITPVAALTKDIRICSSGWLFAEIEALKPQMIVCLGATAAQSFMGSSFRLTQHRGEVITTPWAPFWMATYHPSAILRMIEADVRAAAQEALVSDLRQIPKHVTIDAHEAASAPAVRARSSRSEKSQRSGALHGRRSWIARAPGGAAEAPARGVPTGR